MIRTLMIVLVLASHALALDPVAVDGVHKFFPSVVAGGPQQNLLYHPAYGTFNAATGAVVAPADFPALAGRTLYISEFQVYAYGYNPVSSAMGYMCIQKNDADVRKQIGICILFLGRGGNPFETRKFPVPLRLLPTDRLLVEIYGEAPYGGLLPVFDILWPEQP